MPCNTCKRKLKKFYHHIIVEELDNAGSMVRHICTGCYLAELGSPLIKS